VSNSTSGLPVITFDVNKTRKALCFHVQEFSDINHTESVNKNKTICSRVSKDVKFNYVSIVCYNTEYSQMRSTNKLT
jgi:hypothetical protein